MNTYIGTYLSGLDAGRISTILSILEKDRTAGRIKTREEFDKELKRLLKEFGGKEWQRAFDPVLPDLADPVIRSEDFNKNFRGIHADLSALFNHISRLGGTVEAQKKLNKLEVNKARDAVRKLLEDAVVMRFLRDNPDWTEAKYNSFAIPRNYSATQWPAKVDGKVCQTTLPEAKTLSITDKRGKNATRIEVSCLGDTAPLSGNAAFKPTNAIDSVRDTFWAEVLLAEHEVRTSYDGNTYRGPIIEVMLTFGHVEEFNTLEILPFGVFPVTVVDILTSDDGTNFTTWAGFTSRAASTDWSVYRGAPVAAKCVKVLLLQDNYTPINFLLPKKLVEQARAWEHMIDTAVTYLSNAAEILPHEEKARVLDREYNAFMDAQRTLDRDTLEHDVKEGLSIPEYSYRQRAEAIIRTMFGGKDGSNHRILEQMPGRQLKAIDDDELVELERFEYILGAYTIKVSNSEYLPSAEYLSPLYTTKGQVISVALEAAEDQYYQTVGGQDRWLTSIEYTLAVDENKSTPIVPIGTTRVNGEYVRIDPQSLVGKTRFVPAGTINEVVMLNGEVLTATTDYTLLGDGTLTLNGFVMEMRARYSIVTISYDIAAGQDQFEVEEVFNSTALKHPIEYVNGTDNRGILKLPVHPYIAMEIPNSDDVWFRPDPLDGAWHMRRTAGPQTVDGQVYGAAHGTVLWNCTAGLYI